MGIKRKCHYCESDLEIRHQDMDWCPRCAMVDELIEDLIRKHIEDGNSPPPRSKGLAASHN